MGATQSKTTTARIAAGTRVCFIGDSTLDNIVWVQHEGVEKAVPQAAAALLGLPLVDLREWLADGARASSQLPDGVYNLACDAFTTRDVVKGSPVRVSFKERLACGDPFPTATARDIFEPLAYLRRINPTHVVLSVGGNDIREVLQNPNLIHSALAALPANVIGAYDAVRTACSPHTEIGFCLLYRPYYEDLIDGYLVYRSLEHAMGGGRVPGLRLLEETMERTYRPVLSELHHRDARLSVLDFANSFDPRLRSLYCRQIEPAVAGGAIIAGLINAFVRNTPVAASGSGDVPHEAPVAPRKRWTWVGDSAVPHDVVEQDTVWSLTGSS